VIGGHRLGTQFWQQTPCHQCAERQHPAGLHDRLQPYIEPVKEALCGWVKPRPGGFWTSSLLDDGTSSWLQWCLTEDFGGPAFDLWELDPDPGATVYTIDSYADLQALAKRFPPVCDHLRPCREWSMGSGLSWRRVAEAYDAVRVTEEGQWATRLSMPLNLYGWDCEATIWFRWKFTGWRHVGVRTFERPEEVA
jgi:hypothetical protein